MDQQELINRLLYWNLLVVSLTVHEWAHAWSAWKLGDDTAARMGRLTLNPLVHMDLFGTVLLPLLGAPIGWAKPVPVQPHNFRSNISPTFGMLLTAIAGPISNILLAVIGVVMFAVSTHFAASHPEAFDTTAMLLTQFVFLNLALAVFNMIPVPPLDGSRVLNHFLPYSMRDAWADFERFSPFILIGLLLFLRATDARLIAGPVNFLLNLLLRLASPLMA